MNIPQDIITMMRDKGILEYKIVYNEETNAYDIFIKFKKFVDNVELNFEESKEMKEILKSFDRSRMFLVDNDSVTYI
jgi:hypothetical protein